MKQLTPGSRPLYSGPVGRCSSRGWIRYVGLDKHGHGIYELTASGWKQLEESFGTPRTFADKVYW